MGFSTLKLPLLLLILCMENVGTAWLEARDSESVCLGNHMYGQSSDILPSVMQTSQLLHAIVGVEQLYALNCFLFYDKH